MSLGSEQEITLNVYGGFSFRTDFFDQASMQHSRVNGNSKWMSELNHVVHTEALIGYFGSRVSVAAVLADAVPAVAIQQTTPVSVLSRQ